MERQKKDNNLVWRDTHVMYKDRKCASGVTFTGEYIVERKKHDKKHK